jgi:formate-dependent nitrite reductase membrane component NrfD
MIEKIGYLIRKIITKLIILEIQELGRPNKIIKMIEELPIWEVSILKTSILVQGQYLLKIALKVKIIKANIKDKINRIAIYKTD